MGVYEACLNWERIGDFILAPGCTAYRKRLQCQTYQVEGVRKGRNILTVTVGTGWHRGRISSRDEELHSAPCAVIGELILEYADGTKETIVTDESWQVGESPVRFPIFMMGSFMMRRLSAGRGNLQSSWSCRRTG